MTLGQLDTQSDPDKEFSQQLTQTIRRIADRKHHNLSAVQDEIGRAIGRENGSAIDYWARPHPLQSLRNPGAGPRANPPRWVCQPKGPGVVPVQRRFAARLVHQHPLDG